MNASSDRFGPILGLDVMRAIAVSLVLLCHWSGHFGYWFGVAVPDVMDFAGDTGVELFFALSGFLIGRILIDLIGRGPDWRAWRVFMARRAVRTLPLYFLWLGLLLALFPPREDVFAVALRFATLTQNLLTPMPPDYYFAVTWSLTIEAWFYFLFAGALFLLARFVNRDRALAICLTLFILAPLALRISLGGRPGIVIYRIDEIAYGVLMARLSMGRVWRHPWSMLAAGMGLIVWAANGLSGLPESLAAPLTPAVVVAGCALGLPAALATRRAPAWIEVPVRWIASRSYALYLIHFTILVDIAETRLWEPGILAALPAAVVAIAVPFGLAELSFRLLESPLARRRPRQDALAMRGLVAAE